MKFFLSLLILASYACAVRTARITPLSPILLTGPAQSTPTAPTHVQHLRRISLIPPLNPIQPLFMAPPPTTAQRKYIHLRLQENKHLFQLDLLIKKLARFSLMNENFMRNDLYYGFSIEDELINRFTEFDASLLEDANDVRTRIDRIELTKPQDMYDLGAYIILNRNTTGLNGRYYSEAKTARFVIVAEMLRSRTYQRDLEAHFGDSNITNRGIDAFLTDARNGILAEIRLETKGDPFTLQSYLSSHIA